MSSSDIFSAIKKKDFEALQDVLSGDGTLARAKDEIGVSALLFACYCQFHEGKDLISQHLESLSVHEAAAVGDASSLQIHHSTDADIVSTRGADGFFPLGLASFFGQYEAAKWLIENGADVNQASDNDFIVMPLHSAVSGQHTDIVKLLLQNGADINQQQIKGIAPLHQAAHVGNIEIMELLLAHGADKSQTSEEGLTAADFARMGEHSDALEILS